MNIHVSKNDTFAREIVTEVPKVRKFIITHCISEFFCFVFFRLGGACKHTECREWEDTVSEIRAASKDGWWNGNREVEIRRLARVSLYMTAMPPPRDGRGKEHTE